MLQKLTRKPDFEIEIRRPNYLSTVYEDQLIVTFGSQIAQGYSTACTAYSFTESLSSLDTPFSLSLTLEKDSSGKTWYDKIEKRDLIFIKEYGKIRFVGFVTDRRYQAK